MYAARASEGALRYWENCGGVATLNSYRFGATLDEIPPEHWALLDTCVPYYETDDFIFTHANYLADLPMDEQPEYTLRWALFDPAKERPHFLRQDRRRRPHRAEERRDSRPGLRDVHRHGLLEVRLADGDRRAGARRLAGEPLGHVARRGRDDASASAQGIAAAKRGRLAMPPREGPRLRQFLAKSYARFPWRLSRPNDKMEGAIERYLERGLRR